MNQDQKQKATYPPSDLSHPDWLRLKERLLKERGRKCSKCGCESSEIQIHHTIYHEGKRAWEYQDSELKVLCDQCHGYEHGYTKRCMYDGCKAIIADHFKFCVHHYKQVELDAEWKRVEIERQELFEEKFKVDSERKSLEREKADVEKRVESARKEVNKLKGSAKHYSAKQKEAKQKFDKQVTELATVDRELRKMEEQVTELERKIRQKVLDETELERRRKLQAAMDEAEKIKVEAARRAEERIAEAKKTAELISSQAKEVLNHANKTAADTLGVARGNARRFEEDGHKRGEERVKSAETLSSRMILQASLGVLTLAFVLFFYVLATIGVKQLFSTLKAQDAADAIRDSSRQQEERLTFRSNPSSPKGDSESPTGIDLQARNSIRPEPSLTKVPEDEVSGHLECPRKECAGTMRLVDASGTLKYVCSNSPQCKMKIDYPFKCYRCGAEMVLRDGKNGKFWGCSTFPKCRHTNDYK